MRFAFFFLAAVLVGACNQGDNKPGQAKGSSDSARASHVSWDSTNRYEFINECMQGVKVKDMAEAKAYEYCNCMLYKLEAKFPEPDSLMVVDTLLISGFEKDCKR